MVRTKADSSSVKATGSKAPWKITSTPSCSYSSAGSSENNKGAGGNPYCPRETPSWQKEITTFFKTTVVKSADESGGNSSKEPERKESSMEGSSSS